jgi:hypothetical protein
MPQNAGSGFEDTKARLLHTYGLLCANHVDNSPEISLASQDSAVPYVSEWAQDILNKLANFSIPLEKYSQGM